MKRCLVLITVCFGLVGCGYEKALTPAEPKGFVAYREGEGVKSKDLPFQYVWKNPKSNRREIMRESGHYNLYIPPVSLSYLDFEGKKESLKNRASEIAQYFHERLEKETSNYQGEYLTANLVNTREEADAVLEIALTEIGLGSPVLYTGAWLVPVPGTATAVDSMAQPLLAIEAKLVDADTNEPVAELADRRIPKIRPLDLNKVSSKMGPLRDISNDWAKDLSHVLQSRSDKEKVSGVSRFTLLPW